MGNKENVNSASGEKFIETPNRLQVALYSGKQHRNFLEVYTRTVILDLL